MIDVVCPSCQKRLRTRVELAGKAIRCPACQSIVKLPSADSLDIAEEAKAIVPPISTQSSNAKVSFPSQSHSPGITHTGYSLQWFGYTGWMISLATAAFISVLLNLGEVIGIVPNWLSRDFTGIAVISAIWLMEIFMIIFLVGMFRVARIRRSSRMMYSATRWHGSLLLLVSAKALFTAFNPIWTCFICQFLLFVTILLYVLDVRMVCNQHGHDVFLPQLKTTFHFGLLSILLLLLTFGIDIARGYFGAGTNHPDNGHEAPTAWIIATLVTLFAGVTMATLSGMRFVGVLRQLRRRAFEET